MLKFSVRLDEDLSEPIDLFQCSYHLDSTTFKPGYNDCLIYIVISRISLYRGQIYIIGIYAGFMQSYAIVIARFDCI